MLHVAAISDVYGDINDAAHGDGRVDAYGEAHGVADVHGEAHGKV